MAVGTEAGGDERRGQESPMAVSCPCRPRAGHGARRGQAGTAGPRGPRREWGRDRQTDREGHRDTHTRREEGGKAETGRETEGRKETEQAGGGGGTAQRRKEGRRGQGSRRRGAVWREERKRGRGARASAQRRGRQTPESPGGEQAMSHVPCPPLHSTVPHCDLSGGNLPCTHRLS